MADAITVTAVLLLLTAGNGAAANDAGDIARGVGERTPLFSAVTSQEALLDYNRDFYGRHHLVLSFFPAAFTPV